MDWKWGLFTKNFLANLKDNMVDPFVDFEKNETRLSAQGVGFPGGYKKKRAD